MRWSGKRASCGMSYPGITVLKPYAVAPYRALSGEETESEGRPCRRLPGWVKKKEARRKVGGSTLPLAVQINLI